MAMEQTAISKARVKCPGCRRLFEFDDENRGCATKCPKCQCDFLIPEEGTDGALLGVGSECFDIVCPHCETEFVLPNEYRGEIADCAECHGVFFIPEEGSQGVPADEEMGAGQGAAAGVPDADRARTPVAVDTSAQRRSATVFLSRKEVLDQAEKAQRERMGRLAQPSGIQRAGEAPAEGEPESSPGPSGQAVIELKTTPVLEPVMGRAIRRSELPDWLPPLDFEKREKIVEFEPGAEPPMGVLKLVALVPVLLIPVAAILALFMHPAAAAAICFVPGLVCWGVMAARLLPVFGRKAIILSNFRVIMADPFEVVDIDLL
jgi:hypothetical protein